MSIVASYTARNMSSVTNFTETNMSSVTNFTEINFKGQTIIYKYDKSLAPHWLWCDGKSFNTRIS